MAIRQVSRTEYIETCEQAASTKVHVVVHHTWSPTALQYRGRTTINGVTNYHTQNRGWVDIGYDVMVAGNDIWLCRQRDGGGLKGHLRAAGAHCIGMNHNSLGICLVGNFDEEDPMKWGYDTLVWCIAEFCRARKIEADRVRLHREFANKSCPGRRIIGQVLQDDVRALLSGEPTAQNPHHYAVVIGGNIVECQPKIHEGRLYVKPEPLALAMGCREFPAGIHVHDSGYALGTAVAEACGWVLGPEQYKWTSMGHRWYPQRPEWIY